MDALSDGLVAIILRKVAADTGKTKHLCVCTRWRRLGLEEQRLLKVKGPKPWASCGTQEELLVFLLRFPNLTSLEVDPDSLRRLTDAFFETLCPAFPGLQHLVVLRGEGDTPGAQPGGDLGRWGHELGLSALKALFTHSTNLKTLSFRGGLLEVTNRHCDYMNNRGGPTARCHFLNGLSNLRSLTRLELFTHRMHWAVPQFLAAAIPSLSELRVLRLEGSSLDHLPETITKLAKLEEMELQFRGIKTMPQAFGNLTSLQRLSLRVIKMGLLPPSFWQLTSLTSLTLAVETLEVPEDIQNLRSLRTLHLEDCTGLFLPSGLGHLPLLSKLTLLNMQRCHLLPEALGLLPALQELEIRALTRIRQLPESSTQLATLVRLKLQYCINLQDSLQVLPRLTSLRSLVVHQCRFSANELTAALEGLTLLDDAEKLLLAEEAERARAGGRRVRRRQH